MNMPKTRARPGAHGRFGTGRFGTGRLRAWAASRAARRLAALALGFLYGRAAPAPGMAPLGLAYAAASGQPFWAAAGAAFAALSRENGLVSLACLAVACACRAVFRDTAAMRRGWLMPLCAGAALLVTKSVVAAESGARGLALLLCESLLCLGFACMLAQARHPSAPWCLWGRLTAAGGVMLALAPLRLFRTVAPARAGAMLLTLLTAFAGGPAAGAAAGVALGAAFDLSGGSGLFFAATFCFTGLMCGLCAAHRRYAAAVCAVLANGVATLWLLDAPPAAAGLCECFLAAAALCLLPRPLLDEAEQRFARRPARLRADCDRMTAVSRAVGALGASMEGLWEEPPAADPALLLREAADRVCLRCPGRARCWTERYQETMDALTPLLRTLRTRGALTPQDFPARFSGCCLHLRRLCGALNDGYLSALRRAAAAARDREARANLRAQFEGLQTALLDAAAPDELHPGLSSRVRQMARAYAPRARVAVWSHDGRMHIDLRAPDGEAPLGDSEALLRSLEGLLDRSFLPPQQIETARGPALRISQRERLSLSVSCAARPRAGERVCGDATMQLHIPDGRAVVMLADGMGTGRGAAEGAANALSLLAGFARAGCGLAESAAAVLPALTARVPSRGFVTLDLLEVNLFSGRAQWLKYGAAPGFLVRGGDVRRYAAAALPAGLEQGARPRPDALRLVPGDRLVLVSDGVSESCDVEALLRRRGRETPAALCALLLEAAAAGGGGDDMTALTVVLRENAE